MFTKSFVAVATALFSAVWLSPSLLAQQPSRRPVASVANARASDGPQDRQEQAYSTVNGLLFVDGDFISPPYRFQRVDSAVVSVSGIEISVAENNTESQPGMGRRSRWSNRDGPMRRIKFSEHNPNNGGPTERGHSQGGDGWAQGGRYGGDWQLGNLYACLERGGSIWLDTETERRQLHGARETLAMAGYLVGAAEVEMRDIPESIHVYLPKLLQDSELKQQASLMYQEFSSISDRNHAEVEQTLWLNRAAYPLSTLGMLLVALASGQLLINRPPQGKTHQLNDSSEDAKHSTTRFVFMIIGFSALDLVWTILASHDGSMRELNPIGSHLVSDPRLLIAFKVVTTGVAASILFALRSVNRVHLASWWLCLLLTLLTARWLVFNSLLV